MIFRIIKSKGQWFFKIITSNGKTLCHSEKYKRRLGAAREQMKEEV